MNKPADLVELHHIKDVHIEGAKRQYFPYTVSWTCPHCGETSEDDLSRDYDDLSRDYIGYANINGEVEIPFYCNKCDEESHAKAVAKLTLELVYPEKGER